MLDLGASYKGYHGDITRLETATKPTREQQDAFDLELEALDSEIAAMRPGASMAEVHEAGLKPLKESGWKMEWIEEITCGHSQGLISMILGPTLLEIAMSNLFQI